MALQELEVKKGIKVQWEYKDQKGIQLIALLTVEV